MDTARRNGIIIANVFFFSTEKRFFFFPGCTEIFLQKLHDTPLTSGVFFGIL